MKSVLLIFSLVCLLELGLGKYLPTWDSVDNRPLPKWYDQSKVGIFLHWGVFSVPSYSSEWFWSQWQLSKQQDVVDFMTNNYKPKFTYQDFGPLFTAEFFDPDQWADLFQASGAKYLVLTSKHHEGYTLWPSTVSWNWNSKDLGPKRDLVGDLAKSVRNRTDVRFGIYHSLFEWFHPLYLADKQSNWKTQYFVYSKTLPELVELVETYKPEVIWSDGDWEAPDTYWNATSFLAWLYNDSPVKDTIVVNDRWGIGTTCHHGGYYTCQDKYNPGVLQPHKWENAMTVDLGSWGYRRPAQLSSIMPIEDLISTMVETVSCGGNILINVGPTPDGRIIPIFEERLRQLGSWLKVNGEAIYSSTPWTSQNDSLTKDVWYTQREDLNAVYVHVLKWPKGSTLLLGSLNPDPDTTITMLGVPGNLKWNTLTSDIVKINFPALTPDADPSKWGWVLKVESQGFNDIPLN